MDQKLRSDIGTGRTFVTSNVDTNVVVETYGLAIDNPEGLSGCDWEFEEFGIKIEESRKPYFYPEGPEFRIEYIHERVED